MSVLDMLVVVIAAVWIFIGYRRGFVNQLVSVAGLVAAYAAAFVFYDDAASWLSAGTALPAWEAGQYEFLTKVLHLEPYIYNVLGFAAVFFLCKLVFVVAGKLLHVVTAVPGIRGLNRASGAVLAAVECIVVTVLAFHVLSVLPYDGPQRWLSESKLAPFCLERIPAWGGQLQQLWDRET